MVGDSVVTALTPDDLARIEELWRSTGIIDNDDMRALATGVRSLQARITELEAEKVDAWWEGVNDQRKHRPVGNRVLETQNPHKTGDSR